MNQGQGDSYGLGGVLEKQFGNNGPSTLRCFRNVVGAGTRIFSPLTVARLCVPIGRYWYLFKRLTAVSAGRSYRFEHIVSYSSGKVVAKSGTRSPQSRLNPAIR